LWVTHVVETETWVSLSLNSFLLRYSHKILSLVVWKASNLTRDVLWRTLGLMPCVSLTHPSSKIFFTINETPSYITTATLLTPSSHTYIINRIFTTSNGVVRDGEIILVSTPHRTLWNRSEVVLLHFLHTFSKILVKSSIRTKGKKIKKQNENT